MIIERPRPSNASRAARLGLVAVLAALAVPMPAMAAGPTVSPPPSVSLPPVGSGAGKTGSNGPALLSETPQPCGNAGPGIIPFGLFAEVNAVVVDANANETSELFLEASTNPLTTAPKSLIGFANSRVGSASSTRAEINNLLSQDLVFSIHVLGQVRRSDQQFAKVVRDEGLDSWLICFEDGSDNDYNDLVVRVWDNNCGNQQFTDYKNGPNGAVTVRYDKRMLGDPSQVNMLATADVAAMGIVERAEAARAEMHGFYDNFGAEAEIDSYPVVIEVSCDAFYDGAAGLTQNWDLIKLEPTWMRDSMARYVKARIANPLGGWPIAGEGWADLVDHELFHTYQAHGLGLAGITHVERYFFERDYVNIESSAQLSQDYLADSDDIDNPDDSSYRQLVDKGLADPGQAPIVRSEKGENAYKAGAFLQWLGEQHGDGGTVEEKVVEFVRNVYKNPTVRIDAIGGALGGTRHDALDALRDYWVTMLVSDAHNLAAWPEHFRLLDQTTLHGAAPNFGPPNPSIRYPKVIPAGAENNPPGFTQPDEGDFVMAGTTALIRQYDIAPGTGLLQVEITDNSSQIPIANLEQSTAVDPDRVRLAALPTLANGDVAFLPSLFVSGPALDQVQTYSIPAAGMDSVTLVVVAGENETRLHLKVTAVSGPLAMTVGPSFNLGDSLLLFARPTVGGVFARQQPQIAYSATVDGAAWPIAKTVTFVDSEAMLLRGISSLPPGQHQIGITFHLGSQSVTTSGTFDVPAARGAMSLLSASDVELSLAEVTGSGRAGDALGLTAAPLDLNGTIVGADVSATITDPLGAARTFALSDYGSPVDAGTNDGVYGAEVFGTAAIGSYEVVFTATGVADGEPFAVSRTVSVELSSGIDSDSDGVSDAAEGRFGLDAGDPGDGSGDLDLDGVDNATELAVGTSPLAADSDGGGEADGSEIANDSDPLSADDDAVVPDVGGTATALDGRRVQIELRDLTSTQSARVYRVKDGATTDLGLHNGAQVFVDGPLTAGTYAYVAVAETPAGRRGPSLGLGSVEAREDATAPSAVLAITGAKTATNVTSTAVHFSAVLGAPTQMRLAESQEALEAAAWMTYQNGTSFALSNSDGRHTIWAQLRDGAGNVSLRLTQSITLDLNAPTSVAGPLPAYTLATSVDVPYTASDDRALGSVEVWVRSRTTPSAAWSSWTKSGMGPSPILVGLSDGYYQFASVAVDRAGNREVLPSTGDTEIRVGPERVTDDSGTPFHGQAQATNGRDGTIGLVWVDNRNSATVGDIYFARRDNPTSTWGVNQRVDDAAVAASSPSVAIDASGNVYVAWVDSRRGDKDIYVAKRTASTGVWGASVLINDDPVGGVQDSPSIAVSGTGEVIVAWYDIRGNKQNIYSARLPSGSSTWSADVKVTSDQSKTKGAPSIAIGATGTAFIVWPQTAQKVGVWFSSLTTGASAWATNVQINDATRDQRAPRIGVDTAGRLVVIYLESANTVYARTRPAGSSTWATETIISSGVPSAFSPALTVRGDGYAFAAWTTNSGELWGTKFVPASATWGGATRIGSATDTTRPAPAMTSGLAIVGVENRTGSGPLRGFPVPVP